MGQFDQIWDNLLKISQGDAQVYGRVTTSFVRGEDPLGRSYSTSRGSDAGGAHAGASPTMRSNRQT
jgi:hypothetical protein